MKTFVFFVGFFLISLLFLSFFRLMFFLRYLPSVQGIPFPVLLKSFWIGMRFDTVVMSYLLIPFFALGSLPYIGLHTGKTSRGIFYTFMGLVMAVIFFLSLVDIEFYGEFGSRLNLFAVEYLDKPGVIIDTIWRAYPVILYMILYLVIEVLFIVGVLRMSKRIFSVDEERRIFVRILLFVVGGALLSLGGRGRTSLAPIDWGSAYFSTYDFANQLALNGPYTLAWSLWLERKDYDPRWLEKFAFYPLHKAIGRTQHMIALSGDHSVSPDSSLLRSSRPSRDGEIKPNIVIIILESWQAKLVGVYGCTLGITPNFDSLAHDGILFENMYATGVRTNRGLVSTLCSFPGQSGLTIMKKFTSARPFISLPKLLKERGYRSMIIYGGDLKFDNIDGFFRSEGVDEFVGQEEFSRSQYLGKWGVPDHAVFDRAHQEFLKYGSTPFLGIILTLSNHPPNLLPDSSFMKFDPTVKDYETFNAFYYSDWALGQFFRNAKNGGYFDNTIFVLVADHGRVQEGKDAMVPIRFHIAGLLYAPGLKDILPDHIKAVTSQTDILPTIMGLLGVPYCHESWGRDIFSVNSDDSGFAMMIAGKNLGYLRPPYYLVERVGGPSSLYDVTGDPDLETDLSSVYPDTLESLQSSARAYLEASVLLTKRRIR